MLEMIRYLLILACTTAIIICAMQYLRTHADYRNGLLHKAGNLLSYGYLKMYLTIGHGKNLFHTKMKSIFSSYPFGSETTCEFHLKEQKMEQLRNQLRTSQTGYQKKSGYNLKILK
ncbi:MAG: hypothetical protein KH828_12790 [Clostridiales bacterium]|nr:hypothetical protein [Clostridiales bacterium]